MPKMDFLKNLVAVQDETADDPISDVMLGLHTAVDQIAKSKDGDKATLLKGVFQKAYEAMFDTYNQGLELAYEAGHASGGPATPVAKGGKGGKGGGMKDAGQTDDSEVGGDGDEGEDEDMDKLLKGLPGPIATFVRTIQASNTALAKRLSTFEEQAEASLAKARAREIGEPEGTSALILKLRKADPSGHLATEVSNLLKGKNEAIKKGALFGQIGSGDAGGQGGGNAIEQINAKATEILKASNGKTTFAKAFTQACTENPELYVQHRNETQGG